MEELYSESFVTVTDLDKLVADGILEGRCELLDGIVFFCGRPLMFSPYDQKRAAELGVRIPSWIDAILTDPVLRTEMEARLVEDA